MLDFNQFSLWERRQYLENNTFVIVGAGIVGLSTALSLKARFPKEKILIIERGYLPTGASSKNAGFACFGSPTELHDDLQHMPEKQVWETVALRLEGLQILKSRLSEKQMAWRACGSYDLLLNHQQKLEPDFLQALNQKFEAYFGLSEVYKEDASALQQFGFQGYQTSYFNRFEASIETDQMLNSLFQLCVAQNIQFLYGTALQAFEAANDQVLINTSKGDLTANALFLCTNGFSQSYFPNELRPARAQVCLTQPLQHGIKGTFHSDSGYYYFRDVGDRILFGGGRNLDFEGETSTDFDLNPSIQNALFQKLQNEILPGKKVEIDLQWTGIMCVGNEKKPIIRALNKNVFAGVRMGGMGIAIGSAVGESLSKLV
jgi:glycine/D-amino acid oxidase-like deaminating enzyme